MPRTSARTVSLISSLAIMATASFLFAGPLNPPAGPVASTYKTLTEVEPRTAINSTNTPGDADGTFVISQPGSYYLTSNLTGASAKSGIKITASNVTLDLNGFTMTGAGDSTQGILTVGAIRHVIITNGTLTNWGLAGVDTFSASHCRVQSIASSSNSAGGLRIGSDSLIRDCTANFNASAGISTQNGCVIQFCTSSTNVGTGIQTQSNCVVEDCACENSTGSAGFDVFSGTTIARCSASGNTTGIQTSGDCTIINCTARSNTASGILTGAGCTITGCTSGNNTTDGIRVSSNCYVYGNTCRTNGLNAGVGAGVHATGGANRIESNVCTGADRGIDVDAAGNFITRNSCSGNFTANWDVVAGNACLVVQVPAGAAVLGSSGGTAPGSTDPSANFTY